MTRSGVAAAAALIGPLAVSTVLVAIAAAVSPQQPSPPAVAPPPVSQSVTCGYGAQDGTLFAHPEQISARTLAGDQIASPRATQVVDGPITVTGDGHRAVQAGVRSQTSVGLVWSECAMPATAGGLLVPDPSQAELVLVNSDRVDATVNVTLHDGQGQRSSPGLFGIVVPKQSSVRVPLSVHAPAGSPVSVSYQATTGRVQLQARAVAGGAEQLLAMAPQRTMVFPAIPTAAEDVGLLLQNPTEHRVDFTVEALGARGRFTPSTGATSIEPGTTLALDLTQPLRGQAVALLVTGSAELLGTVAARADGDQAWIGPQASVTEYDDLAPAGTLYVSNPAAAPVAVTITDQAGAYPPVTIPAGGLHIQEVATGQVRVRAATPVSAGVSLRGRGLAVQRLRVPTVPTTPRPGQLDPQLGQR